MAFFDKKKAFFVWKEIYPLIVGYTRLKCGTIPQCVVVGSSCIATFTKFLYAMLTRVAFVCHTL